MVSPEAPCQGFQVGSYPCDCWMLLLGVLGDYIGPYKGCIRAMLGKPLKGTTFGIQPRTSDRMILIVV